MTFRAGKYKRWFSAKRHRRGFGIHSPFAFRLITETLRESDYVYYAYGQLPEISGGRQKLLFRLFVRFGTGLAAIGCESDKISQIHRMATGNSPAREGLCLVISKGLKDEDKQRLPELLAKATETIVFPGEEKTELPEGAMIFKALDGFTVAVNHEGLPPQSFTVDF